jgi:hypothetical protein
VKYGRRSKCWSRKFSTLDWPKIRSGGRERERGRGRESLREREGERERDATKPSCNIIELKKMKTKERERQKERKCSFLKRFGFFSSQLRKQSLRRFHDPGADFMNPF